MDADGDGIGDLVGIRERLVYLDWLGVDAIWISPIFPSPMADFGYDVADYTDIDPIFGTLDEFDELVADAHGRGIRVLLDLVPNHTSVEHPWFVDSRASRDSPKRDWFLWRDPAPDGGPPNNWESTFGGSAWERDPRTGQYYYHAFLPEQPDLNWRNPQVREAMYDVMRFWLDRGVDGFRVDVIWHLIKDAEFRDNPINPEFSEGDRPDRRLLSTYSADRPEVHEVIEELRGVVDEYDDRLLIGEIYLPLERLVVYYGEESSGLHLPFNFQLIRASWDARAIARVIDRYESLLPPHGWPNWVLGNHDKSRVATRVGRAQARVAAMLLLTLRGTPTLYYGDEIGMMDVPISPGEVRDPWERNVPGLGVGRDPQRTPMQWDAGPNAGFTASTPWLPLAADHGEFNVEAERHDPRSMLTLYHRLIELRRSEPALAIGDFQGLEADGDVLAYVREHRERRLIVVLNLGPEPTAFPLPRYTGVERVLLSTGLDRADDEASDELMLRGDEGVVLGPA